MKSTPLTIGPTNQQDQDWFAGAVLFFEDGEQYWENTFGRPLKITSFFKVGNPASKAGQLQTNNQALSFIPNLSTESTFDVAEDIIAQTLSWTHNGDTEARILLQDLYIPDGWFLKVTATSSDSGDTAVRTIANGITVYDTSPGDIDYILGSAASVTGSNGILDVNTIEVGGSTPLSEPVECDVVRIGNSTSAANNVETTFASNTLTISAAGRAEADVKLFSGSSAKSVVLGSQNETHRSIASAVSSIATSGSVARII
jgi:hypothetical protein